MGFINPKDLHSDARLIVFEGMDGVGKTTQTKLLYDYLCYCGKVDSSKVQMFREPGGTQVGELIRPIVKTKGIIKSAMAAMMLFSAIRAELMLTVVKDTLQVGGIVILDRSLYSTVAYQSFGKGIPLELILYLNENTVNIQATDIVYFQGYSEVNADTHTSDDAYELGGDFAERVRQGYEYCQNELWLPKYTHKHEVQVFNGKQQRSISEVHQNVLEVLQL